MFDDDICGRAAALVALYRQRGLTLASAESCTGGLVAGLITSVPGSSDVFERGFVTYSNAAKIDCLGVDTAPFSKSSAPSAPRLRQRWRPDSCSDRPRTSPFPSPA